MSILLTKTHMSSWLVYAEILQYSLENGIKLDAQRKIIAGIFSYVITTPINPNYLESQGPTGSEP